MMRILRSITRFFKNNWKWLSITLGIIALILCLYWGINDIRQLNITKKKIDIAKGLKEIASLENKREALQDSKKDTKQEIDGINNRLDAIKKDLIKRKAEIDKLTIEQKMDRFNKLGY